jgi:hypothetical protein
MVSPEYPWPGHRGIVASYDGKVDPSTPLSPDSPPSAPLPVDRNPRNGTFASRLFDVANPDDARTMPMVVAVWIGWTIVAAVVMLSHEPWRDEVQAWALARSAGTPLDIIPSIRGEGHPPGWYTVLWPMAKLYSPVLGLQITALGLASATTWLTLRHMPVSLAVRSLVVFGYYPLFEYATIARHYVLAYLLVVVVLWLAHRPSTHPLFIAAGLLAIAGTSLIAIPVVAGIALAMWGGPRFASAARQRAQWGWIAMLGGILAVGFFVARPAQGQSDPIDLSRLDLPTLWSTLAAPLRMAVPVSAMQVNFWGQPLAANWGVLGEVLGLGVVIAVAIAVRHSRSALTIWLVSVAGFAVFVIAARQPYAPRIVGTLWLAAIASVWFAAADRRRLPVNERRAVSPAVMVGASVVLACSLWASGWAVLTDSANAFSTADGAAQWVEDQATGEFVVLCAVERAYCASVSIRLDVPAYVTASGEPFTFVEWKSGWRNTIAPNQVAQQARALAARTGAEVFVVSAWPNGPAGCEKGWVPPEPISERVAVCRADQLNG